MYVSDAESMAGAQITDLISKFLVQKTTKGKIQSKYCYIFPEEMFARNASLIVNTSLLWLNYLAHPKLTDIHKKENIMGQPVKLQSNIIFFSF